MPKPFVDLQPKPAALVLSPEAPYPVIGGGPLRTASLLEWIKRRYTVDLIVFREPGSPDPRHALPSGTFRDVFVIDLPRHSKTGFARATRNLERCIRGIPPLIDRFSGFDERIQAAVIGRSYSLGLIEHFWCAHYIHALRRVCRHVILDLHNIESVLLARTADTESSATAAVFRRFAAACLRLEHRRLPEFDGLLVTSEDDKQYLAKTAPLVKTVVYPNTIPLVSRPTKEKSEEIVFSGNLEYQPNISAVRFFNDRIWPMLRQRWPQLIWRIVGRNHEHMRNSLSGDNNIVFTGGVENAVDALAGARAAIAPILAGSGTRVKIIEAWAAGLPVVSTGIGAEGLPCTPGEHFFLADQPEDFGRAVCSLLESPALQKIVGDNGRRLYETELTWDAAWKRLDEAGL